MLHPPATGTQYTYRAHDRDTLLSEIATVQLILLPRALASAGFSDDGKVLMVQYTGYEAMHGDWGCDFFEHQFMTEPLLGVPQQVKAVYVGSPAQLIIPNALYDEKETRGWLRELYPILESDWITSYEGVADDVQYRMAVPQAVHKLLERYFGHTAVLPLAAIHLYKPNAGVAFNAACIITDELAFATLRKAGKLLWHKVFDWEKPEDIAWQLATACREYGMPLKVMRVEAAIISENRYDTLLELETLFPNIIWATHALPEQGHWGPVLYAMQQLYACAL